MEKYKLIIADDDHPSRLILSHFIQLFPQYEIVCEAADGEELIQRFMKKIPDIVLVDVDMPKINGMEAMKICKEIIRPCKSSLQLGMMNLLLRHLICLLQIIS